MEEEVKFKVGDIVKPYGYGGLMRIDHADETWPKMWFCVSDEYDTHFDTYGEDDLTLIIK